MSTPIVRSTILRYHNILHLSSKRYETSVNSTEHASESRLVTRIIEFLKYIKCVNDRDIKKRSRGTKNFTVLTIELTSRFYLLREYTHCPHHILL